MFNDPRDSLHDFYAVDGKIKVCKPGYSPLILKSKPFSVSSDSLHDFYAVNGKNNVWKPGYSSLYILVNDRNGRSIRLSLFYEPSNN